jgi:hypothetical protein
LRPAPGKIDALNLDHAGATLDHGFGEDPIKWSLSEDRRAENRVHTARTGQPATRLTNDPECSAVMCTGEPCDACGWRPRRKPEAIKVADGELGRVERDRSVRTIAYTADEEARFYRQLLWIAREQSYNRGWAAHKFKDKFDHWPAAKPWENQEPEPPDAAVRSWVRSRQIAYANTKQVQRVRS